MKKHTGKILILLLALLMVFALAACNDQSGGNDNTDPGGNDPITPATYTVRFDANGGADFGDEFDLKNVAYGSTVSHPTRNGELYEPWRTGYIFNGWNYGSDKFVFEDDEEGTPTRVTSDITISASWVARQDEHILVTSANSGKYPYGGNAEYGSWTYEGNVTLVRASGSDVDPVFKTEYDNAEAVGAIPTVTSDVEGDWFAYWYYVTVDKDGNVTEVPFTTARTSADDDSALKLLSEYTLNSEQTLYPKMHSQLPVYTLKYGDEVLGEFRLGDTVNVNDITEPTREGYVFDGWYYTVTTGSGENEKEVEYSFVLLESTENGDNRADATVLSEDIATSAEDGYTLSVYPKWVRTVTIGNEQDLNDFRTGLEAALTGEDEVEKYAYINAQISFADGISLTLSDAAPLYTADAPFAGELQGNGAAITMNYTDAYTGSVLAFIGASKGSISDLTVTLTVNGLGSGDSVINIGAVGRNSGSISSVTATLTVGGADAAIAAEGKTLYIGALAARQLAGAVLEDCSVTKTEAHISSAAAVYVGGALGIAGDAASSAKGTTVAAVTFNVTATGSVYAGGFVGNALSISAIECTVSSANIMLTASDVYAGGFAGALNGGNCSTCVANSAMTVNAARSARSGGFVGENKSLIANCSARTALTVNAGDGSSVYAGGIAGTSSRFNIGASATSSATGDINTSYGGGRITVNAAAENASVRAYVGGVAGRMSDMRSERAFADVDIELGAGISADTVNAFVGATQRTVNFSGCYYASDCLVNGAAPEVDYSNVKGIESDKFKDSDWLHSDEGLNLDPVWQGTEDGPVIVIDSGDADDDTSDGGENA